MNVYDGLYLGSVQMPSVVLNEGVGPAGALVALDIVPLTKSGNCVALAQATTSGTALTLAALANVTTSGVAPDGSGRTVIVLDVPRAVSLTSTGNLTTGNITVVGFDQYGQQLSQKMVGPGNTTVNSLKAFKSVLSATPDFTGNTTVSVGTADIFGFPFAVNDLGYLVSVKWASALAADAGTAVAAVTTSPATTATGDVRGTYVPSSASNGSRRLVATIWLPPTQSGPAATLANVLGVTQV